MSILITSRCNSRCAYCDSWQTGRQVFQGPTIDDIVRLAKSAKQLGVREVSISGGEPLIRNDLEDIIAILSKAFKVVLTTNGILLTRERVTRLVNSGLNVLILSLDSLNAGIYQRLRGVSLDYAEQALECLIYAKEKHPHLKTGVNCVVNRYNINYLQDFSREFFKRLPRSGRISFLAYDRTWKDNPELIPTEEQYPVLIREIENLIRMKQQGFYIMNSIENLRNIPAYLYNKKIREDSRCISGSIAIWVDAEMKLHPCSQFPAIADLRVENLEKVWFSGTMGFYREKMLKGECPGCACVFQKRNPFQVTVSQFVNHLRFGR